MPSSRTVSASQRRRWLSCAASPGGGEGRTAPMVGARVAASWCDRFLLSPCGRGARGEGKRHCSLLQPIAPRPRGVHPNAPRLPAGAGRAAGSPRRCWGRACSSARLVLLRGCYYGSTNASGPNGAIAVDRGGGMEQTAPARNRFPQTVSCPTPGRWAAPNAAARRIHPSVRSVSRMGCTFETPCRR